MKYASRTRNVGFIAVLLLAVAGSLNAAETPAKDHADAIAPYVNDDTFVAAGFDLAALANTKSDGDSLLLSALPFFDEDPQTVATLRAVDQVARGLHGVGVHSVYIVAGLADIRRHGGPLFVFAGRQEMGNQNVAAMLKAALASLGETGASWDARVGPEASVLVGSPATLGRYAKFAKSDRLDLTEPLGTLSADGAAVAAVFCPGPDFRRVVRELWPDLPGELAPLRGELADKWRHLEVGISASPNPRPSFALEASDAEAAATFVELWNNLPMAFEPMTELGDRRHELKKYLQPIVDEVRPHIEGTRVIVDLDETETQLTALRNALGNAAHALMESQRRHSRVDQFKRMMLAMHNYHSAKKRFPASAIYDKAGEPLLSWRVAILPYIDEIALYKQFRLDEPWGSPHNRQLVAKMPAIYADPDPELRKITKAGKTTYQVPAGPETIFPGNQEITVRDVTDGTSKTIAIVEVAPSRAVEWTKPQDWEVNMQDPREGLAGEHRKIITVAIADGSVTTIPVDAEPAKLRGLLTRGGREVFDWP